MQLVVIIFGISLPNSKILNELCVVMNGQLIRVCLVMVLITIFLYIYF